VRLGRRARARSPEASADANTQASVNERLWRSDNVARYANRTLRPVEVILLMRHHEALAGRVLELGCGAGRVLGYLGALGGEVHAIDVSPAMVEYCRRRYPGTSVHVGNLLNIGEAVQGPFDAVLAPDNVLDVIEPEQRRRALREIRGVMGRQGVLIFSSHNLAHVEAAGDRARGMGSMAGIRGGLARLARAGPVELALGSRRLLRRRRNRRRLAGLERRAADHAILNDSEGDFGALHYYVRRDDQERQLAEAGFVLIECLDVEGRAVDAGDAGDSPWLHYVARPG
jgi:SAM-dependent methyltransferase